MSQSPLFAFPVFAPSRVTLNWTFFALHHVLLFASLYPVAMVA
jgi:hypothetical protein